MECYRCPVCLHSSFNSLVALWQGLMCGASRRLSCPVCSEVLLGLDKLTLHLYGHLPSHPTAALPELPVQIAVLQTPAVQPVPDAVPSSGQVGQTFAVFQSEATVEQVHQHAHVSGVLHQCGDCGISFSSAQMLNSHRNLVHSTATAAAATTEKVQKEQSQQQFGCHLCSRKFKMKGSLMVHMRFVHGGARKDAKHKRSKQQGPKSPPLVVQEKSMSSPPSFPSMLDLQEHLGSPESLPSEPTQEPTPSTSGVTTPQEESSSQQQWKQLVSSCLNENFKWDNKVWECDVCGKKFTTKYFQKKHQRLHTGERPYQCTTCGKSFAFQQSFHKHLLYHTTAKPHVCAECGQAFKELSTLHNHERIHTGERPFVCETCGKAFRQRVSYLVHRRIHTGALPYKCTACEKSFRYKVSQRTHKCTAQPPGDLVRQSDLVQRLLSKTTAPKAPPEATIVQPVQVQTLKAVESVHTAQTETQCPIIETVGTVLHPEPLLTINEESLRQLLAIFPPN